MNTMDFLSKYKATTIKVLVVIALIAGAFAAGRYTLPAKVIEHTKEVEVLKEVVRTEIQIVEKKVYVRGEDRDIIREVVVIKQPDGTEVTKTTETDRTKIKEASSQETETKATKIVYRDKEVFVEKLKIVENGKDWHLSVSAGAGARFVGTVVPQLVFGATVERRIVGPFFMGLNVSAAAGITPLAATALSPPVTVTGSLVLGLEF